MPEVQTGNGWFENEHGLWCPLCGNLVVKRESEDDEIGHEPETCSQCGFPDEIDHEKI